MINLGPPAILKYRQDIDGLRAVAVLFVVIFHAFPEWVDGGFIGVDVFFVISGFLISKIVRDGLEEGTFSFSGFYVRRIRRIFPALLLVLVASFICGWFALLADEYKRLGKHIAGGAGFVSNFMFWSETGYFDNSAETKPLLHLWSLGVEEQFYIFWPLLLWLAKRINFSYLALAIVVAITSFCLNLGEVGRDAAAAFYLPQTRMWELLCGGILVFLVSVESADGCSINKSLKRGVATLAYRSTIFKNTKMLRDAISCSGFLLLLCGVFFIKKEYRFPGGWAIVPVLATVLIIAAGPSAWVNRKILSNRLAVWLGLISFPMYLWHWPLLSFARIVEGALPSITIRIVCVAISVALAWATYRFVERPIRFSKPKITILVLFMAGVGFTGYGAYLGNGFEFREANELTQKYAEVYRPTFANNWSAWLDKRCKAVITSPMGLICRFTTNAPKILVIGDSHAAQLAYESIFNGRNDVAVVAAIGCLPFKSLITVDVDDNFDEKAKRCHAIIPAALRIVEQFPSISYVVFASRGPLYIEASGFGDSEMKSHYRIVRGANDVATDNYSRFIEGYVDSINAFLKLEKSVVFVEDVPEIGVKARSCLNDRPFRISNKSLRSCVVSRKVFDERNARYRAAVDAIIQKLDGKIRIFPAYRYFCDETSCSSIKNGTPYYVDDDHLSLAGSRLVFGELLDWLDGGK